MASVILTSTMASDRAILYGNVSFSILMLPTKKRYSSFLKKVFLYKNLFQSFSIENVQNSQWLSRKNMSIFQTEVSLEYP